MGSELSHRALHSCTSHSRLQLRAPRVWSGHGTGLAPVCTPGHCVQLSTAQSGAAAGSRRKVREIENSDERATRAFRQRKQVGAVRWKRERRIGAAYAQGRRRHRLHDDDLSDPEYEYTHTHVIMTEGILKYSRFCDKNILMIHFLLLSQNYPQPDNEIHQKNLCSRSSKI